MLIESFPDATISSFCGNTASFSVVSAYKALDLSNRRSSMPGRIESPSTQLGQLLLRGYTMLAAACDDCQIPLMRDPQTMQSHCVSCRRLFDTDGNLLDDPESESVPPRSLPGASTPTSQQSQSTLDSNSVNNSISPAARPSLHPAAGFDANGPVASSTASQQLLAVQQQQRTLDLQQREAADSDEEREVAEIRARLQQQRLQEAFEARRRQRAAAAGNGTNDPSQLLADQLLAGWTMLAESCPICYTPLMRSRDHEVRCIACNLPVVIEQQVQQPAQLQSASSNTAVGVGPEQVPAATAGPASVNVGQEIGAQATSSQQKEERASDMQGTLNEGQVPNASCTSVDEGQVLRQLRHVLLVRLQETTQQLDATSSPQATPLTGYLATAEQLLHCLEKVKQVMSL